MPVCPIPDIQSKVKKLLREDVNMSTGGIIGIIIAVLMLCCCFTHRRVIKALINHEPMPKAPKWHCWVKKENRRG